MAKPKKQHRLKAIGLGSGGASLYKLQAQKQAASMQVTRGAFQMPPQDTQEEPTLQSVNSSAEFLQFHSFQGEAKPQDKYRMLKIGKHYKEKVKTSTTLIG